MIEFEYQAQNGFTIILSSDGTAVTGETSASVTAYASKDGGSPSSVSFKSFTELDATNMAGLYRVEFDSAVYDTLGELIFNFTGSNFDDYRVRGEVKRKITHHLSNTESNIATDISSSENTITSDISNAENNITGEISDVKGSGFDPQKDSLTDQAKDIRSIEESVTRILGLSDENVGITNYKYDDNDNVTEAEITLYQSAFDLNNNGSTVAEYKMKASYDSNNRLEDYTIEKI